MRVGVVIPVYSRPGLILECLESIAAQARAPDVVIVVDDASPDDTADRAQSWMAKRNDGIGWRLLRQPENGGAAGARNRALGELGDCDLIAFLDSDDLWPPEHLRDAESALAAHPDAVAAVRDLYFERTAPGRTSRVRDCGLVERSPAWEFVRRGAPTPSSVVVRQEALVAVGGFDAAIQYAEDLDCYLKLTLLGSWIHVPGPPIRYRVDAGSDRNEAVALTDLPKNAEVGFKVAKIVEDFCRRTPPDNARALLSLAWFRAACDAHRAGDWARCREYSVKAIGHRPWHPRAAWRWVCAGARSVRDSIAAS